MTPAITTNGQESPLADTLRRLALVAAVRSEVMREGTHYGPGFPGDKKQSLHKPGADALCLAFQLVPEYDVKERELGTAGHREYRTTCTLRTMAEGRMVSQGVGTCSTMESKYRWRNDKPACPKCGAQAVINTKRGHWCAPDKGGCGANPEASAIESQPRGKVENPDIADQWNTVLKMSKKRAHVDAVLTATAASDLFTQDAEDLQDRADAADVRQAARNGGREPEAKPVKPEPEPQPAVTAPPTPPTPPTPPAAPTSDALAAGVKHIESYSRRLALAIWFGVAPELRLGAYLAAAVGIEAAEGAIGEQVHEYLAETMDRQGIPTLAELDRRGGPRPTLGQGAALLEEIKGKTKPGKAQS